MLGLQASWTGCKHRPTKGKYVQLVALKGAIALAHWHCLSPAPF